MFATLRRLLGRKKITMVHPTLGELEFDQDDGVWGTVQTEPIYHGGIPGCDSGPDSDRVNEVINRLVNMDSYWVACSEDLLYIASTSASFPQTNNPKDIFRVTALSLYPNYWEVCVETHTQYKWLYVGMQFEGEELVSNTISR